MGGQGGIDLARQREKKYILSKEIKVHAGSGGGMGRGPRKGEEEK